jgi:hypothetical protein
MQLKPLALIILLFFFVVSFSRAQNLGGLTGLLNIPSAHMQKDGTMMLGAHFLDPSIGDYGAYDHLKNEFNALALFGTVTFLPFVEGEFRYTFLLGVENWEENSYFGDRMMSVKIRLLNGDNRKWPSISLGFEDFVSLAAFIIDASSPSYFASNYIVASKKVQPFKHLFLDFTLGYGYNLSHALMKSSPERLQHDGLFGGLELRLHDTSPFGLMLEYDSRYWNAGFRLLIFKHIHLLASMNENRGFSGGFTYKFVL